MPKNRQLLKDFLDQHDIGGILRDSNELIDEFFDLSPIYNDEENND